MKINHAAVRIIWLDDGGITNPSYDDRLWMLMHKILIL